MKKNTRPGMIACLFFALAGFFAVVRGPAAETMQASLPPVATGAQVAVVFYRLAGQTPDFAAWAAAGQGPTDPMAFRHAFYLLTLDEPLVVERAFRLAKDSAFPDGFLAEELGSETFFDFTFMDRNYALVPLDAGDYQWFSVPSPDDRARIEAAMNEEGRVLLRLFIVPEQADGRTPMSIGGKDYWLLSGRIGRIQVVAPGAEAPVWEALGRVEKKHQSKELLDLYR